MVPLLLSYHISSKIVIDGHCMFQKMTHKLMPCQSWAYLTKWTVQIFCHFYLFYRWHLLYYTSRFALVSAGSKLLFPFFAHSLPTTVNMWNRQIHIQMPFRYDFEKEAFFLCLIWLGQFTFIFQFYQHPHLIFSHCIFGIISVKLLISRLTIPNGKRRINACI